MSSFTSREAAACRAARCTRCNLFHVVSSKRQIIATTLAPEIPKIYQALSHDMAVKSLLPSRLTVNPPVNPPIILLIQRYRSIGFQVMS